MRLFLFVPVLALTLLASPLVLAQTETSSDPQDETQSEPQSESRNQGAITPLTLARVLELALPNDPDVIVAKADLVAAERALTRQLADPLALEVGDLEAERAAETARAALASARLTSKSDASSLFFTVLNAEASKALAARELALARAAYQAVQIRAEVGAASGLEVLEARNAFGTAQRANEGAGAASLLAYRELAEATGLSSTELLLRGLASLPTSVPAAPTLSDSLARAQRENTEVAAARSAVQLARARVKASSTIFTARVDLEAAQDEVTQAQSNLTATTRQLTLSVRSAYNALTSARRTLTDARATRRAYAQELEAQRTRLQVGAISQSAFSEAELTELQNAQAEESALHTVRLSRLALEQAISGSRGAVASSATETDTGSADDVTNDVTEGVDASSAGDGTAESPDTTDVGSSGTTTSQEAAGTSTETESPAPSESGAEGDPTAP